MQQVAAKHGVVPSAEGQSNLRQRPSSTQGHVNPIGSMTSVDIKVEEQTSSTV
jgi:hypothetical protein